uniref:Uncharacterized protein n=1 Tax=Magallana gigas TaxID=29159 RepID=A0A8W8IJE2_MAGGI
MNAATPVKRVKSCIVCSKKYNTEIQEVSEHNYAGQPKLNVEELYVKHHPLSLQCSSTTASPTTDVLGDSTNSNKPMNKTHLIPVLGQEESVLNTPPVRKVPMCKDSRPTPCSTTIGE